MEGPIELLPEAKPLNFETLVNTLIRASSANQQQVQTGTQQLQNWEREPGLYSSLQSVFIETSLPLEVRYLSAIQLKNGIDKYWRKTASNAIGRDEKILIRSRCLESGISELDHRLAIQNALLIAKITRFEFPHDWPDVLLSIAQYLRSTSQPDANPQRLSRTLLILLHIIKELSTARLQRSRSSLQSAAPEVFQVLAQIYIDKVQIWMQSLQSTGDREVSSRDIENSLIALRVLRRLTVAGYEFPNRSKEVQAFWVFSRLQLGETISLLNKRIGTAQLYFVSRIEKIVVQLSKLHLEMARNHPAAFALLPGSPDLTKTYWRLLVEFGKVFGSQTIVTKMKVGRGGDAEDKVIPYMEKLSLKGLLILRSCMKMVYTPTQSFKYMHVEDKWEKIQSMELIKREVLTEVLVREMMETLVTQFFVFRPRDLREWEEEPDEWERREEGEGDAWEFSIRSCSEKLFLDLVINNKDLLTKPLLNVFYTVATPQNTDILRKDSIYAAIGLAAPMLENELDFGGFLKSTLVSEVQHQQAGYNILRRRIAIVLGQWLGVKHGLDRPLVYQVFQHLLDKEDKLNDLVVRVTAGRHLKSVIDPFDFVAESFMPFAPILLSRLLLLVEEVELSETKLALLNTVSVIVVRGEHHINPVADQILSSMSIIWSQSEDEFLIKQSILGILSGLITSMKDQSQRFHTVILPLIQSSIDPSSDSRAYLLEDALDLWAAILIQTSSASPELFALTAYLFPMFETADETLRKALEITESYVLLYPGPMLNLSRLYLSSFTTLLAASPKREASGTVTHLAELLIQAAEIIGGADAIKTFTTVLLETKFLTQLLTSLHSAYSAHQTTGPNRGRSKIDGIVETDHISVLARLALSSPTVFIQALTVVFSNRDSSFDETVAWILAEWFSHFENIGSSDRKKLNCLALTALLNHSPQTWILSKLQDLMSVWMDVVTECMEYPEERDNEDGRDCLVYWDPDGLKPTDRPEAPEEERRRNMIFADPVHRLNVKNFIRERLQQAIRVSGGEEIFQRDWLVNVDADIVRSFSQLGIL
ncbi:hypothetical protein MMC13_005000 [Lambiella insularis]|nr:hypothetical protein [Lambiella insularis]